MERVHSARRPQPTLYSDAIPHVRTSAHIYTDLPQEKGHSNGLDVGGSPRDRRFGRFSRLGSRSHHHADRRCQDEDHAQRCGQRPAERGNPA